LESDLVVVGSATALPRLPRRGAIHSPFIRGR
jgi:hypothetical protein